MRSNNILYTEHFVTTAARCQANGHHSGILWLTGLSASGKTTLAFELDRLLFQKGWRTFVLDGDNVRHGLCSDLGFSADDRAENIRRIGEVAKLFAQSGCIVITAFISPYRADRDRVRAIAGDLFHEVHIAAPLAVCEARDPKGLYGKARRGEIHAFTGISAPYEEPLEPELVLDTSMTDINQSLQSLLAYVSAQFTLN